MAGVSTLSGLLAFRVMHIMPSVVARRVRRSGSRLVVSTEEMAALMAATARNMGYDTRNMALTMTSVSTVIRIIVLLLWGGKK